ncbi:MAG TPA: glycogen synthase GlgA [Casimicrobiaceae bacterium]|nr:glycogen synthase GlgA [Casimicrobiaceae bacterium]
MSGRRVLSVASEIYPLVKTGGLADVVGALPRALAREGIEARTLVPGYPAVLESLASAETVHDFPDLHGGPARLVAGRAAELDLYVLDAPHLYARPGNPYVGPDGKEWPDNARRFAALAQSAAAMARGAVPSYVPQIAHAHDWQAGLVPAYLRFGPRCSCRSVMTVHNLAFQGQFPRDLLGALGLPPASFGVDGVEYYGTIGYLKAGLALADRVTTVSPTYAAEIRTAEAGMGLDGLLRQRAQHLSGILNGIDVDVWNPATDPHIAARYDAHRLHERATNKAALQARLGLAVEPGAFVFGVVSRLTWQKGIDVVIDALPALLGAGAQLAVLGSGDASLERALAAAARDRPGRLAVTIGHDEALAHQIQAGIDALLMPSRFEPCGLAQLIALRYGAIPVVPRVGGLADTVIDANEMALASGAGTGVQFSPVTREQLELAIARTLALARNRATWRHLQTRAMATDVSWARPARRYATLYRELVPARAH